MDTHSTGRTGGTFLRRVIGAFACSAAVAAAGAAVARPAEAQIFRVPGEGLATRPPYYVSFSVGLLQSQDRFDGTDGDLWLLGDGVNYRFSLERGVTAGALGLTLNLARVSMARASRPGSDGDIQLRQYLATFRTPEADGFFQVIEVGTGLSQWTSYSGTDVLTDEERKARNAFTIQVGYGFGFRLGRRGAINLVQDYAWLIGSKEGLPSGASRSVQQSTTRLGARVRF